MNIIAWLRTPLATLIVLCSALLAQLPHAADVFRLIVMGEGLWPVLHSYTYAVALELAVLLFVVQRRNVESYLFAGVSILVNLSYYALHGLHLWSVAALPAWLVSIALPATIAQYSHLIAAATAQHDSKSAGRAAPAQPIPQPALDAAQGGADALLPAQRETQEGAVPSASLTPAQRRAHIREQEIADAAQIAAQFGVSLRTAQEDLRHVRRSLVQKNGVGVH